MADSSPDSDRPSSASRKNETGKNKSAKQAPSKNNAGPANGRNSNLWGLLLIGLVLAVVLTLLFDHAAAVILPFGEFETGLRSGRFTKDNVFELRIGTERLIFQDRPSPHKSLTPPISTPATPEPTAPDAGSNAQPPLATPKAGPAPIIVRYEVLLNGFPPETVKGLIDLMKEKKITNYSGTALGREWGALLSLLGMLGLILVMLLFLRRMGPGSAMSFVRSRGKMYVEDDTKITFDDVAGIDEAVEELKEIVEFLKTPAKYQALGGRIPRGVLLVGPPGTGKTLLAKAVAGEAEVPFFSLSGSDFVELYVGVGASRVRDLFQQAVQRAPSIVFIDELDALGKRRGDGGPGNHDERDQTLNALLVEMDGFSSDQSVIVMAATNRPEILDPALMRPGRFDRHVLVDRPDYRGREAILRVHSAKVKLDDKVDLHHLAKLTSGFAGADLASLCNEAALLAARRNKTAVSMKELEESIERVIAGLEKTSRILHEEEKQRVAFHEAGHALVSCSLPHCDPVHKISIIPRGFGALGYVLHRPEDDRFIKTQIELQNKICVLMGGIVAEELVFQETSTGPQNDLERATDIARRMITEYGMSPKLGRVNYHQPRVSPFGPRGATGADFIVSEETLRELDLEVKRLIDESNTTVREILRNRRGALDAIANRLLEKETLDSTELDAILDQHKTGPQIKPGTYADKKVETPIIEGIAVRNAEA